MNDNWQNAALAHGFTVETVEHVDRIVTYELCRAGVSYGPFSDAEAQAFVGGLNATFGARLKSAETAPDTCAKQPEPTEADSKLAALTACSEIVNGVEADFRCNVIQALATLFGVFLPLQAHRPLRNYDEADG